MIWTWSETNKAKLPRERICIEVESPRALGRRRRLLWERRRPRLTAQGLGQGTVDTSFPRPAVLWPTAKAEAESVRDRDT
jgi:hypothetical protein